MKETSVFMQYRESALPLLLQSVTLKVIILQEKRVRNFDDIRTSTTIGLTFRFWSENRPQHTP